MERSARPDIVPSENHDFRGLTTGLGVIAGIIQDDTSRQYAAPPQKLPSRIAPASGEHVFAVQWEIAFVALLLVESVKSVSFWPEFTDPRFVIPSFFSKSIESKSVELRFEWSWYALEDEKDVLNDLVKNDRHDVAQRLNDLIEMFVRDPDVGNLNFASLKLVAEFFKQNNTLKSAIVAGWDGTLSVEWRLPPVDLHGEDQTCGGILGLEFLPDGQIEYLGFIKPTGKEERVEYEGVAGHNNIIDKISSFLKRM